MFPPDGLGGGPSTVRTTSDAGAVDVVLRPAGSGQEIGLSARWGFGGDYSPGEVAAGLLFLAGGTIDGLELSDVSAATGRVTSEVFIGAGSSALLAVEPDRPGPAANVGSVAAGTFSTSVRTDRGLVGGFLDFSFCHLCVGSWTGPDGEEHSWYAYTAVFFGAGSATSTWGGGAGDWSWSWAGTGGTSPLGGPAVYAAYAPIGDLWPLFA